MKVSEIVGEAVRAARESAGMSQAELGRRIGEYLGKALFPQAVSELERGRRQFTAEELLALACVLGRPISYFFLPREADATFDFPARTLPLSHLVDGPLIGGANANGIQALLQEALDVAQDTAGFVRRMHDRADAIVDIATMLAIGGTPQEPPNEGATAAPKRRASARRKA